MDIQNEFRSLISQVQKFCRQEQDVVSELVDSKTVAFFVKNETPKIKPTEKKIVPPSATASAPAQTPIPTSKPQIIAEPKKPVVAKPTTVKPPETKIIPKEPEVTTKEEALVQHVTPPTGSFLSTLPSK